jgi:uncharacterized FAD-dependent dehydrogenase
MHIQQQCEQKAYELGAREYRCPTQRASDFMQQKLASQAPNSSYPRAAVSARLSDLLPEYIVKALLTGLPQMDRIWRGQFLKQGVFVGPEARGSSPVRIVRDSVTRQSPIEGFYPVGEGAGYAGGIVSAAVDGLRTAKAIIAKYAPIRRM